MSVTQLTRTYTLEAESLASRRLSGSTADRHIAGAVSQTHSFVPVPRRINELHNQFMTLSVQGFWLKSQFIAKMELAQDFF
jgi:hypothetical protein